VAGILQRAVQVLDRLYNFPGGTRGLREFDLASAIQPVHDLSREAEFGARGAQDSGYLYLGQTIENDTGGSATIKAASDVYALFDSIGEFSNFRIADHRLWLMTIFGQVDTVNATNWTSCQSGIVFPNNRVQIMAHFDADLTALIASGGKPMISAESNLPQQLVQIPQFFPLGASWNTSCSFTNDAIARIQSIWWAGPIGVTPPGMR